MKEKKSVMFIGFLLVIFLLQSLVFAKTMQGNPNVYSSYTINSKFTNGEFFVKYNSADVNKVILYYGTNIQAMDSAVKTDCECGRNIQCSFKIDLKKYEDNEIKYFFVVIDKKGNIGQSIVKKVKVDTISPVITNSDNMIKVDKSLVNFNINIIDKNFDRVQYIDNFDSGKSIVLCKNCKSNCGCKVKKRFIRGDYSLTITAFDKAGNSVSKDVSFSVV
jgi:hypothetical protein